MKRKTVAVISCGSIGERYIKILGKLNFNIIVWNRTFSKALYISKKYKIQAEKKLKNIADNKNIKNVFICSPTNLHIKHAQLFVNSKKNIFIEKPLSHNSKGIENLKKSVKKMKVKTHVSCNLRFHDGPKLIKKYYKNKSFGKILWSNIWCKSFLPDWHKNRNYKSMYSSLKHLGGGAVNDYYHEIDLCYWLFGKPKKILSSLSPNNFLKIQTEEGFDAVLKYAKYQVNMHCNYFQKKYSRGVEILFEHALLKWSLENNIFEIVDLNKKKILFKKVISKKQYDKMYKDQVKYFFETRKSFSDIYLSENVHKMSMQIKKNK